MKLVKLKSFKKVANHIFKIDIIKASILSHDDQNEDVGVAVEVDAAIVSEDGLDLAWALFSFLSPPS